MPTQIKKRKSSSRWPRCINFLKKIELPEEVPPEQLEHQPVHPPLVGSGGPRDRPEKTQVGADLGDELIWLNKDLNRRHIPVLCGMVTSRPSSSVRQT